MEFFPPTQFVDADTFGYENVKDDTDIKLLHLCAPTSSLLSQKIKTFSENPPTSPRTAYEADENFNKFRHAVLYSTVDNLTNALSTSPTEFNATDVKSPKICFLITCQATQYAEMGKQVYEWSPIFRQHFDECDTIIKQYSGMSVKNLMDSADGAWVSNPLQALPYILSLEYALSKLWLYWGIKPDVILGMSFGEYGAAVINGIITLKEAVKLIMTRTQLVTNNIAEEALGAVAMDFSKFPEIMEKLKKEDGMEDAWLDIACVNSPLQTCVVGFRRYVHKFVGMLTLE